VMCLAVPARAESPGLDAEVLEASRTAALPGSAATRSAF
jgi:hypothetical protein